MRAQEASKMEMEVRGNSERESQGWQDYFILWNQFEHQNIAEQKQAIHVRNRSLSFVGRSSSKYKSPKMGLAWQVQETEGKPL